MLMNDIFLYLPSGEGGESSGVGSFSVNPPAKKSSEPAVKGKGAENSGQKENQHRNVQISQMEDAKIVGGQQQQNAEDKKGGAFRL